MRESSQRAVYTVVKEFGYEYDINILRLFFTGIYVDESAKALSFYLRRIYKHLGPCERANVKRAYKLVVGEELKFSD